MLAQELTQCCQPVVDGDEHHRLLHEVIGAVNIPGGLALLETPSVNPHDYG